MKLLLKAPAKINWTFEVLGPRTDGYQEVRTVLQTIGLCDTLTIEPADRLALEHEGPQPTSPEEDLALRAAHALRQATGCPRGALLRLRKEIPAAVGLGGGSSDAAAALRGLNDLWRLRLTREELAEIGAALGSDVPFFVYGGTALAEGRGERITPLPDVNRGWLVLLVPPLTLPTKTASMYRRLRPSDYSDGDAAYRLAEELRQNGDPRESLLTNAFQRAALAAFPGLGQYWEALAKVSGRPVHLAGSGPAIFALPSDEAEAQVAAERLGELAGARPYVVATLFAAEAMAIAQAGD